MKGIGHSFIVYKVLGEKNLAVQGALLPEVVPYLARDIFEWSEIHEGGMKFYEFLQKKEPQSLDLALGLLTHGITFGADKLNDKEWQGGEGYAHQKAKALISDMYKIHGPIAPETAKGWAHNCVELGLDLQIQANFPEFLKFARISVQKVAVGKIAALLADCFKKDEDKIKKALEILFCEIYTPENFADLSGLVRIWDGLSSRLPEAVQPMNAEFARAAIRKGALLIEADWKEFLDEVIKDVRKNLTEIGVL